MSRNILLIIPTLGIGGAERAICSLSIELSKRGHKVWLCHFDSLLTPPFSYDGELVNLNVTTGTNIFQKISAFIFRIQKLRKLKKELRIEISISFLEGADYVNILSKRHDRLIVSVRSSKIYNESSAGPFRWIRSRVLIPCLYNKADFIVAIQENVARELLKQFHIAKSKIRVIYNHYDIDFIKEQSQESIALSLKKNKTLICSGRLTPIKGFLQFLDVFERLKQVDKTYQLWILGDGPLKGALIGKALALGLSLTESESINGSSADVVLLGNQSNPWKYVSRADLFIVSSYSESFGNALAEALFLQVPIVSTDCPYGPRMLLLDETPEDFIPTKEPIYCKAGILMPLWNKDGAVVEKWAAVIEGYFKSNNWCPDNNYINQAVEKYSAEKVINQWEQLFR